MSLCLYVVLCSFCIIFLQHLTILLYNDCTNDILSILNHCVIIFFFFQDHITKIQQGRLFFLFFHPFWLVSCMAPQRVRWKGWKNCNLYEFINNRQSIITNGYYRMVRELISYPSRSIEFTVSLFIFVLESEGPRNVLVLIWRALLVFFSVFEQLFTRYNAPIINFRNGFFVEKFAWLRRSIFILQKGFLLIREKHWKNEKWERNKSFCC